MPDAASAGQVAASALAAELPDPAGRDIYVAGEDAFVEAAMAALDAAGLAPDHIVATVH